MTAVKIGQIWLDKDKRRERTVKIIGVGETEVHVQDVVTKNESSLKLDRFVKRWDLIKEAVDYVIWDGLGSIMFLAEHEHVHDRDGNCLKDRSYECTAPKINQTVKDVPERTRAKQPTYMLKLVSPENEDYKLRMTAKMIEEYGYPIDPWGNQMELA